MDGMTASPEIPAHVPPERVRDIDIFELPGAHEDSFLAWKRVQDASPDIFFWPRHGGYWVLNRAALVAEAFPDFDRFSSAQAISIPPVPGMPPQLPIDADPPLHAFYRRPINVALLPRAVRVYAEEARTLAVQLIETIKPRGECEFVADFARQLPMTIFLRLVDLPIADREKLIGFAERMIRGGTQQAKYEAMTATYAYLEDWVKRRRDHPGDDLLSRIIQMQIEGRTATHEEALGECALVLFGGLDTVAGTMAYMARFLASNPSHRQQLVETPALIPAAMEELLRRHSIASVGRRVARDMQFSGVHMKAGDGVMLVTSLHGLDERAWPDPLKVDFTRKTEGHMAFGAGPHKCPGSVLARAELQIFLEEWLKRIPDFTIAPGRQAETLPGQVLGVATLPLAW
ncbi:MAG TPA: cytochrome P450 [Acetobacteraceae bacterium]|nr:cytochrome P450 [Acetobacteraceae bacterium]